MRKQESAPGATDYLLLITNFQNPFIPIYIFIENI